MKADNLINLLGYSQRPFCQSWRKQMNREPSHDSAHECPDCVSRRNFLKATGVGVAAAAAGGLPRMISATPTSEDKAESLVKVLYESLTPKQKEMVCFDWNHEDAERGVLRTRISNNWHITNPVINSEFYTADQQRLVRDIFESIIQPEWHSKIYKQLEDDAGGFGNQQNIAMFGAPGQDKCEFVMTGRHMTLRCDGNTTANVAFGGPIFYGHAASGFNEKEGHPGNVFWPQALAANKVYEMLDGKQRKI